MNLNELKNKTILLFGKSRAFSQEEFYDQMKFHNISVVKEHCNEVVLSVDGKMMTPYEQNSSDELYEMGKISSISIDVLDKNLAKEIDEDTLLMSLKLSHDKDRLKSFLQNEMISDKLFLRLIKLYRWGDDDFFENDDNRDVSAAFISRFYENIERNHNVQYATTGFIHLVAQARHVDILKAIWELKPLKFHPKIESAIAMSIYSDEAMQKKLYKSGKENILEALAHNKKLSKELVSEFIKEQKFIDIISRSIDLDDELFELLNEFSTALSLNESLSLEMQEKLFAKNDNEVNYALSLNDNLNETMINKLLDLGNEKIEFSIYENNSTPQEILIKAYENPATHMPLSKNENTPIEILYQLQLDARYERFVKTNAAFGRHIQSENIGWEV